MLLHVCALTVCTARNDLLHAGQVPAGLHIPPPRQVAPRPYFHCDTAGLHGNHVGDQDDQNNCYRLPSHGQCDVIFHALLKLGRSRISASHIDSTETRLDLYCILSNHDTTLYHIGTTLSSSITLVPMYWFWLSYVVKDNVLFIDSVNNNIRV